MPLDLATVPPANPVAEHVVQLVGSGPDTGDLALHKVFFTAINHAAKRIWLTTPYFVPDDALLTALLTAALRGVDVRVLVPKKGDSRMVDLAARSYFPELLEAKVRIFEYEPRFIHAKTLLCDDDVSIVGTANFDNRSFRLNFELCILFEDAGVAGALEAVLARDFERSRQVVVGRPLAFRSRLAEALARLLSPLL